MKTMLRVILPLMLCVVLFLCLAPSAGAESGDWGNLGWTLDDNGLLTISGDGEMDDFDYGSTEVWRGYSSSIKAVVIEQGVTSIGSYAFYCCTSLTSVTIPDSVTGIGYATFSGCADLTSVTIPDSVTFIGDGAFSGCTGLTSVTIPDSVTGIGGGAFYGCAGLTSVTIPDSVIRIGGGAFYSCTSLTSVTIPSKVTSINYNTFYNCASLTSITIPDSVTSIDFYAFYNCTSLTSILIPDSVTFIGDAAFSGCTGLTDAYYGGTQEQWDELVARIGSDNEPLINATIHYNVAPDFLLPSSLTEIGEEAFTGGAFGYAKLPEGCAAIGPRAFADCPNLEYIYIPASTTDIDDAAFGNRTALTILGVSGSYAETFAAAHGFSFVAYP